MSPNRLRPQNSDVEAKDHDYWINRLYQNTFTRNGKQFRLRGWSVKIQYRGVRRAVTLRSHDKGEAAREAAELFGMIENLGWEKALLDYRSKKQREALKENSAENIQYWKSRLLRRRYIELARGFPSEEYSVRIEHDGTYHYFLLGKDEDLAAAQASQIQREVLAHGWEKPRRTFEREFTVAIYWANNPLACTYTTLVTQLKGEGQKAHLLPGEKMEVWLVCAEPEIALAVQRCIQLQNPFYCARIFQEGAQALEELLHQRPAVLLVNRDAPGASEIIERMKTISPEVPIYPCGIYDESDQIFMSFVGIKAGYILQRREPKALFNPLQAVSSKQALTVRSGQRNIRHYFQNIFQEGAGDDDVAHLSALTAREQEIMTYLTRGLLDKELAEILDVSYWTIHNHLKKIYQKLGVHNRTEAVVKYLGLRV